MAQRPESKRKYDEKYRKEHKFYMITLTLDEDDKIQSKITGTGIPANEFIKAIALNYKSKLKPREPRIHLETKAEIGRIGNNLNQVARQLNNIYIQHDLAPIRITLKEIENGLKGILRKLD